MDVLLLKLLLYKFSSLLSKTAVQIGMRRNQADSRVRNHFMGSARLWKMAQAKIAFSETFNPQLHRLETFSFEKKKTTMDKPKCTISCSLPKYPHTACNWQITLKTITQKFEMKRLGSVARVVCITETPQQACEQLRRMYSAVRKKKTPVVTT